MAVKQKQIAFLCPNGHKLYGPAALQGKLGQCSECGAKFKIPYIDESEHQEEGASSGRQQVKQPPTPPAHATAGDKQQPQKSAPEQPKEQPPEEGLLDDLGIDDSFDPGYEAPELTHPMAILFETLWQERNHGGVLEIHVDSGPTIVPDWWSSRLSAETHAVFAIQTADGSYVIETLAWDSIKRVTVRRISELPDGVFE